MKIKTTDPRFAPALILCASIAVLAAALAFQYIGGLQPCVLCMYQRYPYGFTIAFSLVALALARQSSGAGSVRIVLYLCALAFAADAAIAVFHVGVEQHWWRGTPECGATTLGGQTMEELEAALKKAPVVRCDQIAWSLFGISMAGYNAMAASALALFSLLSARAGR